MSVEFFDPDNSDIEDRFIRIGHSAHENMLLIVFCERDERNTIRIVSGRKTTSKEKRKYEEGI